MEVLKHMHSQQAKCLAPPSPPTSSPPDVVPAGSAPSGWWHTSFPVSLGPAAERRSPPAASFSLAVAETPDNTKITQEPYPKMCILDRTSTHTKYDFTGNKRYDSMIAPSQSKLLVKPDPTWSCRTC